MDSAPKPKNYFENALFAILGALSASVLSLGVFGSIDNRTPASIETPASQQDFDARVFMAD